MPAIKPWLFEFFHEVRDPEPTRDPAVIKASFDWHLGLWTRAEARGFEGIHFSEHHFGAAYSPSPNLLIAAMAGRTTTLRLGSIGTVSAYATPWRVAEEFAMLDHLTGGRIEIGVVSGIPPEFMTVNMSPVEARVQHDEVIDVLLQAVRGPIVSHHGKYWNFDNLRLVPQFLQERPNIWTAIREKASAEIAGRRGIIACAGFTNVARIADQFDVYRTAASDAGNPYDADRLAIRRSVVFVDNEADRIEARSQLKLGMLDALKQHPGPLPPFARILDTPEVDDDVLSHDEFISGTPSQVAEQLIEQCRITGAGHISVMLHGHTPEELDHAHQHMADTVIPALRNA